MNAEHQPGRVADLRELLDRRPDDHAVRLRLGGLLVAAGDRKAARDVLEPLETLADGGPAQAEATARLAALDEEDGNLPAAIARWERLLADDIDHPEARARLGDLGEQAPRVPGPAGDAVAPPHLWSPPTLVSPEGAGIHRFEILRELGRGATSTVYLARDRVLHIQLALKVLHGGNRSPGAWQRIFHEARLVATLRHPGVVSLYDLDEAAHTLVMEYLPGGSLRDGLQRLRSSSPPDAAAPGLPPVEAARVARVLLSTLAFVHDRGVIHGDITPRNVLFRSPGTPVLADFGIARILGTEAVDSAGTPIYLAPEQFRGEPSSHRTDLFSLGAVLWEALAGRPMRTHADLLADRFVATPLPAPIVASFPAELRGLVIAIDRLTAAASGDRPQDAGAALQLLQHAPQNAS